MYPTWLERTISTKAWCPAVVTHQRRIPCGFLFVTSDHSVHTHHFAVKLFVLLLVTLLFLTRWWRWLLFLTVEQDYVLMRNKQGARITLISQITPEHSNLEWNIAADQQLIICSLKSSGNKNSFYICVIKEDRYDSSNHVQNTFEQNKKK